MRSYHSHLGEGQMRRRGRRQSSNRFRSTMAACRSDPGDRGAAWVRPDNPQAAVVDHEPGTVTGVRRLYPGVHAIEREVDLRESHTSVLHTDRVITRVASFKINEVVHPGGQDICMSCIDCKRRLGLEVLRG